MTETLAYHPKIIAPDVEQYVSAQLHKHQKKLIDKNVISVIDSFYSKSRDVSLQ